MPVLNLDHTLDLLEQACLFFKGYILLNIQACFDRVQAWNWLHSQNTSLLFKLVTSLPGKLAYSLPQV